MTLNRSILGPENRRLPVAGAHGADHHGARGAAAGGAAAIPVLRHAVAAQSDAGAAAVPRAAALRPGAGHKSPDHVRYVLK